METALSQHFLLRPLQPEDAEPLFACYGDATAVHLMNDDNCPVGFFCKSVDNVRGAVNGWMQAWPQWGFKRLAIVERASGLAVGTVELCDNGVLRLDICTRLEKEDILFELFQLLQREGRAILPVPIEAWFTKAIPDAAQRVRALEKLGATGGHVFKEKYGHYFKLDAPARDQGVAYCGLVCGYCHEQNDACPGCRNGGCPDKENCRPYQCCTQKGYAGCWECPDFPCTGCILDSLRIRTFARYAGEHGQQALLDCLKRNAEKGIQYHYEGSLKGDYDQCRTEEEIVRLLEGK